MVALLSAFLYVYAVIGVLLVLYAALKWEPGDSSRAKDALLAGILILFFVANFAIIPKFFFGSATPIQLETQPSPVVAAVSPTNGSSPYSPVVSVINLYRKPVTVTVEPSWGSSHTVTTRDMIFQIKLSKFPPKSDIKEITDKDSGVKIKTATGTVKVIIKYGDHTVTYDYVVSFYQPEYSTAHADVHVHWYEKILIKLLEYALKGALELAEKIAVFMGSIFDKLLNFVSGGTLAPSNGLVFLTVMPVKEMFILPNGQSLLAVLYYTMLKFAFPLLFILIVLDLLYRSYIGDEKMLRNLFYDILIAGGVMIFGLKAYELFATVINTIIAYLGIGPLMRIAASISNWLGSAVAAATAAIAIKLLSLDVLSPTVLSFYAGLVIVLYFVFIAVAYLRILSILGAVAILPFTGIFYLIPPLRNFASRVVAFIIKQGIAGIITMIIFILLDKIVPYPFLGPVAIFSPLIITQLASTVVIGRIPMHIAKSSELTLRQIFRLARMAVPVSIGGFGGEQGSSGGDDSNGGFNRSSGDGGVGGGSSSGGEDSAVLFQATPVAQKPVEEQQSTTSRDTTPEEASPIELALPSTEVKGVEETKVEQLSAQRGWDYIMKNGVDVLTLPGAGKGICSTCFDFTTPQATEALKRITDEGYPVVINVPTKDVLAVTEGKTLKYRPDNPEVTVVTTAPPEVVRRALGGDRAVKQDILSERREDNQLVRTRIVEYETLGGRGREIRLVKELYRIVPKEEIEAAKEALKSGSYVNDIEAKIRLLKTAHSNGLVLLRSETLAHVVSVSDPRYLHPRQSGQLGVVYNSNVVLPYNKDIAEEMRGLSASPRGATPRERTPEESPRNESETPKEKKENSVPDWIEEILNSDEEPPWKQKVRGEGSQETKEVQLGEISPSIEKPNVGSHEGAENSEE